MKRPKPDLRPSWRDPNLKIWVGRVNRWVTKEEMQRSAQKGVQNPFAPSYDRDPTYDLKAKKTKLP